MKLWTLTDEDKTEIRVVITNELCKLICKRDELKKWGNLRAALKVDKRIRHLKEVNRKMCQ